MRATVDKPWVLVQASTGHTWARAVSAKDIIAHAHRLGMRGLVVEKRQVAFGEAMAHYMRQSHPKPAPRTLDGLTMRS